MRKLLTLSFLLPIALCAQTTWMVEVGGSLAPGSDTLPYYTPDTFAIALGDIVQFNCVSGKHNVYGGFDEFPANAAEFWSHLDPAFSPWIYSKTFTVAGVYEFMCTADDHAITQMGRITVIGSSGITPELPTPRPTFTLFPVPANDRIMISLAGCKGAVKAQVLNAEGQMVREQPVKDNDTAPIDLGGLPTGQYYMVVEGAFGRSALKPFVKF